MWIDRKAHDDLRMDNVKLREESRVLNQQNTALLTTLDWLRVRVTQLELERAQLIHNYTGVQIPVPAIHRVAPGSESQNPMNQLPNFNDIGDEEAAKLGIGWHDDGTLLYTK